jgi:hypothetical protein
MTCLLGDAIAMTRALHVAMKAAVRSVVVFFINIGHVRTFYSTCLLAGFLLNLFLRP